MVKLQTPETINTKEGPVPIMHKHRMTCLKDAPSFTSGETGDYYIARYDGLRYCVFTASFIRIDSYHVFESEKDLHEHFEEV